MADDLESFISEVKEFGDKKALPALRKAMTEGSKAERKSIRDKIRDQAGLPHRGGLDKRVGRLPAMTSNLRPGQASIQLTMRRRGSDFQQLNKGVARHPVWGNRKVWRVTRIRAGWWEDAAEPSLERLRDLVETEFSNAVTRFAAEHPKIVVDPGEVK